MKTMEQTILRMIREDAREHSAAEYARRKAEIDARHEAELAQLRQEHEREQKQHDTSKASELARLLERRSGALERELLSYRQELLDEIFDQAVERLRGISRDEFVALVRGAVTGIQGKYVLRLGEYSQGKLAQPDVDRINAAAEGLSLLLSDDHVPSRSGFVLSDERVEYSCLFEDLIEEKRNQQLATIQKEAFLGDEGRLSAPEGLEG